MFKKLEHIAIAVANLSQETMKYRDILGFHFLGEEVVEEQGVKIAFFEMGGIHFELLEPLTPDSAIAKFLTKKGEGIHHIAYEVNDIKHVISQLKEQGIQLLDDEPKSGSRDSLIAFIHPKSFSGVLVELVQKK